MHSFVIFARTSVFGAVITLSTSAFAQSFNPLTQPLSDVNCQFPVQFGQPAICIADGTRTTTPTTGTITPSGGGNIANGDWAVNFSGNLLVDGVPVITSPGPAFNFDASNFGDPAAVQVHLTTSYTGKFNNTFINGPIDTNNMTYFQQYLARNDVFDSISVQVSGEASNLITNAIYSYKINSVSPTILTNGNTVALAGTFRSQENPDNALIFGTLSGTATVNTVAGITSASQIQANGAWFSPYNIMYNVPTAVETTRLDSTGLITPTITVTNGINLSGSKITGLADGTAATDAVNLGQLNARVAINGTPLAASAAGADATAVGGAASAAGSKAVALGSNANAAATEGTAVGADTQAFGADSVALGKGAKALGSVAVAIGPNVQALSDDSIGIGAGATPIGARSTAIGRGANAVANGTAIGAFANAAHSGATAIGANAVSSRANQVKLGGAGTSVAIGDIGASDAAQSGAEFFVTVDSSGTLGKGGQSSAALSQLGSKIEEIQSGQALIDDLVTGHTTQIAGLSRGLKQANGGIAAAMAMGGTMIVPDSTVSLNFNLSTYRGQQGFSGAIAARLAPKVYVSGGFAGSTIKGSTGGRVGLAVGF
jgi:trimeric autotransporter adhesin